LEIRGEIEINKNARADTAQLRSSQYRTPARIGID
jgi:hypothetical protein